MVTKQKDVSVMMKTNTSIPVMSYDPVERLIQNIQRWDPSFTMEALEQVFKYPMATDVELMKIYLYGGARPFVDFLVYVDLGVGWKYRAVGFENKDDGIEAVKVADEFTRKIQLATTMNRFATLYEVLGRSCLVKTKTLAGGFYYDKYADITGVDCISPITLTDESIKEVNIDTSGTKMYEQVVEDGTNIKISQDRMYYRTQNNLSGKKSLRGTSRIQGCVGSYRTLAKFPEFQSKLGRLYSEVVQTIIIDTSKMEGPLKDKMMENTKEAQKFLDETAEYYRKLARKGSIAAVFDWFEIVNTTFAGKEVNIDVIEDRVLASIGRSMGVPLSLIDMAAADKLTRSVLEAVRDTNIAMQEKGTREHIYKPIIEEIINEHLESEGITGGRLECEFNPFLSDDLLKMAQMISLIWQTESISKPEVRDKMKYAPEINLGGKEWKDKDPMPSPQKPTTINVGGAGGAAGPNDNNGPKPDGNQNPVKGGGVAATPAQDRINQLKKYILEEYSDFIQVMPDE